MFIIAPSNQILLTMLTGPAQMFSVLQSIRVLQLADTAAAFGLDPQALFANILDIEQVRARQYSPSWHESIRMMASLMRSCAGKPVAVDFGKRWTISSYGTLGMLISSMENLRSVFNFAGEITHLVGLEPPYVLVHAGEQTRLELTLTGWSVSTPVKQFIAESLFTSYARTSRMLLGGTFPLNEVSFSHPAPPYSSELEALFDCPVYFNRPYNSAVFAAALLTQTFPTYNPHIAGPGLEACRELVRQMHRSTNIADSVRLELSQSPGFYPDRTAMAKRFCLESRTFSRRLESEGVTYQDLITQAKMAYAKQLLSETATTSDIALKLGYCDEANFRRAFKSWTGTTPAGYRVICQSMGGASNH